MGSTPFLDFWEAVNAMLASRHLPQLLFGEAKSLWHQTEGRALRLAMEAPESRLAQARRRYLF